MDIGPIAVYYYQTSSGRCPFKEWFNSLDEQIQQIVDARLTRVRRGLFGHAENLSAIDAAREYWTDYLRRTGK